MALGLPSSQQYQWRPSSPTTTQSNPYLEDTTNFMGPVLNRGISPTPQLQSSLNYFTGLYSPEFEQNAAQRTTIEDSLAQLFANQQLQSRYANEDYQSGLSKLNLSRGDLGIERGAAGRQIGLANTLEALARELLGNQMQGFNIDTTEAGQSADQSRRQAMSSATARGAVNAPGIGRTLGDIQNSLANQLGRIDLGRGRADIGFRQEQATLGERRAGARDRLAQLDLKSKELGINSDQLRTELDRGLQQLGLDTFLGTNQLMDALGSSNIKDRMLAEQIFREAIQYTDVFGSLQR